MATPVDERVIAGVVYRTQQARQQRVASNARFGAGACPPEAQPGFMADVFKAVRERAAAMELPARAPRDAPCPRPAGHQPDAARCRRARAPAAAFAAARLRSAL
jgi:hypothetical protein